MKTKDAARPHPLDYTGDATQCGLRFVDQIFPAALVTWLHKPRGGYGYVIPVPATVRHVQRASGRVTLAADLAAGGTTVVTVDVANLRWRRS